MAYKATCEHEERERERCTKLDQMKTIFTTCRILRLLLTHLLLSLLVCAAKKRKCNEETEDTVQNDEGREKQFMITIYVNKGKSNCLTSKLKEHNKHYNLGVTCIQGYPNKKIANF